ncbi:hypothetical protein [Paraburkholderia hospita]|uniref:hypothetical protein n=1 Tax=Paraburkholderia hospita TaxID=169430 RepID=UPI003ECC5E6D
MSIKTLIDDIRATVTAAGVKLSMARGRDLISKVLFDRSYSAAIAAERAEKLSPPQIESSRTERLKAEYGEGVDVVADIAALAIEVATPSDFETLKMIMTSAQAIQSRIIPAHPLLTVDNVNASAAQATQRNDEIEWVRLHAQNVHQGKHLRFFRVGGNWYAFKDVLYADGSAFSTAVLDNCVFHLLEQGDADDSHCFLSHVFEDGGWSLQPIEHSLADPEDFDLTWEEFTSWL